MAIGKAAVSLILASAAWAQEFPAHHEHGRGFCAGTLAVDSAGIRFRGRKGHVWEWPYRDIQQLTLSAGKIRILTYKDSSWALGKDVAYTFTGEFGAQDLARQWGAQLDQRFVAAVAVDGAAGAPRLTILVKQLGLIRGSEGTLMFGASGVVYDTPAEPRTWRYGDIRFISSGDTYELSITTLEKQFRFQLKQALSEATYNQLWLEIERKNGRIQ